MEQIMIIIRIILKMYCEEMKRKEKKRQEKKHLGNLFLLFHCSHDVEENLITSHYLAKTNRTK